MLTSFLRKPLTMTTAEFRTWWLDEHVPLVKATPGLRDYVVCPVDAGFNPATRDLGEVAPYDGVAILVFDSEDDFKAAFQAPAPAGDDNTLPAVGVRAVSVVGAPTVVVGALGAG